MGQRVEKIWDPLVRLFHWSLVLIFAANYFFNEKGGDWHQWLGYTAGTWVLVRFAWGFVGPRAARWSDFFPTPARLAAHSRALLRGEPYHRLGHTPIGALVMIIMMLCVLGLGVTGYMMQEVDYFWGSDPLENVHGWFTHSLLLLAIVHIAAALFESYRLKDNLVRSMVTGERQKLD